MYELNRIRLFGAGPRGARYTDVLLDLSAVGQVIPTQGSLFSAPPRRPSPFSLLLLENGGGKSVLLKLLFSVVLPGKRNAVGGSAAVMEKFVVGDDPAHVVLEWMHVQSGARVVTGKTLQRRKSAGVDGKLAEAWWSIRPTAEVDIETLPFSREGRRLRIDGFREALDDINRCNPAAQLTWLGGEVGEWATHLRSLGIEPDLFSIQRRMNADEGDAANAFTFKSSKEFVDWLLRVVLDPQDATSVAENFDSYATTVGDRTDMLLERDFVAGAVGALMPAAIAWERFTTARAARATALYDAGQLLAAITARAKVEETAANGLVVDYGAASTAAAAREVDRERARDITNEIRRQTLALELTAAETRAQTAADARDNADAELRAWAATEPLERAAAAEEQARQLGARIIDAEHAARPALLARDTAAGMLLAKLAAETDSARSEADAHNGAATAHSEAAAALDGELTNHVVAAERARAEHRQASRHIAQIRQQVEQAVADGLLKADDDVADIAARAAERAATLLAALAGVEGKLGAAARDAEDASRAAITARDALGDSRTRQERAASALQQVADRAAPLVADEIVLTALGVEAADVTLLDESAETLAAQFAGDEDARETQRAELRRLQLEDQRILDALGDGGLLPARAEVDATLDVLHSAGIAAHAGWRYLAENAAAADRAELITAHPELADGVVLVDPAALPAARAALQLARLLPAAAIAVSGGGLLLTPAGDADGGTFVVEPTPALFDPDAAEARREQLRAEMDGRGTEISVVSVLLDQLREVRAELTAWRRFCPTGRLAALGAGLADADTDLAQAAEHEMTARTTAEQAEARRTGLEAALRQAQADERAASDRSAALALLAQAEAGAVAERRRLGELEETAAVADRRAEDARAGRDRETQQSQESARAAENASDRAGRHLAAMAEVVTSTGEAAADVPAESLSALTGTYRAAVAAYLAVEVGQDLRAEADRAEVAAAQLRSELAKVDPADVARGRHLLAGSDGADPASRRAATARLQRARVRHDEEFATAQKDVGRVSSELTAASPSERERNVWIVLPEQRRPVNVAHGRGLLETAAAEQRAAQQALEAATELAAQLERQAQRASAAVLAFTQVLSPLEAQLEDAPLPDDEVIAFDGDAEAAKDSVDRARALLRSTGGEESVSRVEVGRRVDAAVRFASEPRFEAMGNVARRALVGLEREQIGARALEFAGQLEQRLATLTTDLESAGRHRKLIVDRLCALVDGAFKTLRTASRLSKLPAGLGDWEGKEFLRIRFSEPDPSLLAARIGEVVDDTAAALAGRQLGSRGSAPKRDGLALLLRGVEAAVPKGFTVDVLKPDSVLRDERVPVAEMSEVFSGGQELTAAIVLYCTIAALRANERGHLRARHNGVLFLDNPIGKANAEYLLELQQGVAAALGVQLVYTTGLSDDRALAAFPLWVRMRNDADLRAGMKHIRVAEVVRRQLPEAYSDEELGGTEKLIGTVTSTRVFRRPA